MKTMLSRLSVIGVFVASLVSVSSFAGLEEEVDALTPDQAFRIVRKLEAKQAQPIPESFFTKMAVMVGGNYRFSSPDAFNSSTNASFSNFGNIGGLDASFLWNLSDCFSFGLGFGLAGREETKEISTSVFQEVKMGGVKMELQSAFRIPLGESWLFVPLIGVGVVKAGARITTSSDSAASSVGAVSTHEYKYSGYGWSGTLSTSFLYRLNPILGLGMTGGFTYSRVLKLKRSGVTEILSPADINLSGPFVGSQVTFNL